MKETELYIYIKTLFKNMGYTVKSEVKDIDILATKDEEMIIIEMKTTLNLKLILQGVKRQKLSEKVYLAIPKPSFKIRCGNNFKDKELLLRRLSLGLIFVDINSENPHAYIQFDPLPFNTKISMGKSKKKKERALKEAQNRSADYNTGGTNKKIMTAYKENSILIAFLIDKHGPSTIKFLKENGGGEKTNSILQKNYSNWFYRVSRGVYDITDLGKEAAKKHNNL